MLSADYVSDLTYAKNQEESNPTTMVGKLRVFFLLIALVKHDITRFTQW